MKIAVAGATGNAGRHITAAFRAAGHEVLELSRSGGVDLTTGDGLDLTGVDVVVDATNPHSFDQAEATAFFQDVSRVLGDAARAAGVRRTVLVSIIGVTEATEDNAYYSAKVHHESASHEHAPGLRILRAAQFHEMAGQMLEWMRDGDVARIQAMPIQPVDLVEVARQVVDLATNDDAPAYREVAGPRREQLDDLSRRLAGDDLTVETLPATRPVAAGVLLPGPDAVIGGRDFDTWLADRQAAAVR